MCLVCRDVTSSTGVPSVTLVFRYDGKSVKLAPEASYTAPPVSTHSVATNVIIKPGKTRGENTPPEGEAEEVLYCTVRLPVGCYPIGVS